MPGQHAQTKQDNTTQTKTKQNSTTTTKMKNVTTQYHREMEGETDDDATKGRHCHATGQWHTYTHVDKYMKGHTHFVKSTHARALMFEYQPHP